MAWKFALPLQFADALRDDQTPAPVADEYAEAYPNVQKKYSHMAEKRNEELTMPKIGSAIADWKGQPDLEQRTDQKPRLKCKLLYSSTQYTVSTMDWTSMQV